VHRAAGAAHRGAQGYYTDLAKWAAKKGFKTLRVDGEALPTAPWPRLSRFRDTPSSCRSRKSTSAFGPRPPCAPGSPRARFRQGAGARAGATVESVTVFSTKRLPSCGRSFAELDPRLFSFNSRHGCARPVTGPGVEMPGFDEQKAARNCGGTSGNRARAAACGTCHGQRLNPRRSTYASARSIAALAAIGQRQRRVLRQAQARQA